MGGHAGQSSSQGRSRGIYGFCTASKVCMLHLISHDICRHEWYQNDEFVFIVVFQRDLASEQVTVQFAEDKASLAIATSDGAPISLSFSLAEKIVPEASTTTISPFKIEMAVKKKSLGQAWRALEADHAASESMPAKYPSSSKKPHDWDKLDKELEKEIAQNPAGLDSFFRDLYSNASEETRRAMIKSFTESSGTVLSTNWDDVGKRRIEPAPPEGTGPKQT